MQFGGTMNADRRHPVAVDLERPGAAAAFLFDCAGDSVSCSFALQSVGRSLAVLLADVSDDRLVVAAGEVVPSPELAFAPTDPYRPERFVATLQAPRFVLCAALRIWSRLAPRTAVAGGLVGASCLPAMGLRICGVIERAICFLPVDDEHGALASALRGAVVQTCRIPRAALETLASPR